MFSWARRTRGDARRLCFLLAICGTFATTQGASNPSYGYGYREASAATPAEANQLMSDFDEGTWPQEGDSRTYDAAPPPYTVDRSELRRTVATPYSTGQHLQYRGKTVHRQQDFRPVPDLARQQDGGRVVAIPTAVHNLLGQVQGPFVGMVFAYYAWRTIERYSGLTSSRGIEKYGGFCAGVAVPMLITLMVSNLACSALGFLGAKGQKKKLKAVININGLVDMTMFAKNLLALLINPLTQWIDRAEIIDALVVNLM